MISFSPYAGGRDDAKLLIPATVLLRYMFTTAEMMVSSELSILCYTYTLFFSVPFWLFCSLVARSVSTLAMNPSLLTEYICSSHDLWPF